MTPEERAERIIKNQPIIHFGDDPLTVNEPSLKDLIVSAIREAVEEAIDEVVSGLRDHEIAKKHKAEAYEDAVSLIETLLNNCNPTDEQLSALWRAMQTIKARAAEVGK